MAERDASERLDVSVRTLQKWRLQGSGPRFVKLGRSVRYDAGDIEQYIEAARRCSTSQLPLSTTARSQGEPSR